MRRITTGYDALTLAQQSRLYYLEVRYGKQNITDEERAEYFALRTAIILGPEFWECKDTQTSICANEG